MEQKDYQFFLERIPKSLGVGYFRFFASLTIVMEACRLLIDYVTIVWQLGLSTNDLIVYWTDRWLLFLWPICMLLMYYSMKYLRNCTLRTLEKIQFRLKEYPVYTLEKVYLGRWQHFFPVAFVLICFSWFTYEWFSHTDFMIGPLCVESCEMPLKFLFTVIWITFGWMIGGYFSHACIGTIPISCATSRRVEQIDVFNFDRAGGLSAMGSLAMKAAVLYIFSVSFMFPGWVFSPDLALDIFQVSNILFLGVLIGLVMIEFGLFLLPMGFFRSKMKEAKEKHLARLDSEIANFYGHLTEDTTSKGDNKGVEGIIALRQLAESMHEYPFNLQMLAKVGSSAIIPLLIVLLQKAAELALGAS
ncbi:MAG: hypothetical protein E3J73_05500 [Candidatus Bathyarchaeum sp.]|nr:MAG: hypothetical protein E3J73_05500 [Candidatus Bathyarchaeum sp.]